MPTDEIVKALGDYAQQVKKVEALLKGINLPTTKYPGKGASKEADARIANIKKNLLAVEKLMAYSGARVKRSGLTAIREANSVLKEVDKTLSENIKSYQAAVKNSDGLTSVRPSVVKTLQAVRKTSERQKLDSAVASLRQHAKDVRKEAEKREDRKVVKKRAQFVKELDRIEKNLGTL